MVAIRMSLLSSSMFLVFVVILQIRTKKCQLPNKHPCISPSVCHLWICAPLLIPTSVMSWSTHAVGEIVESQKHILDFHKDRSGGGSNRLWTEIVYDLEFKPLQLWNYYKKYIKNQKISLSVWASIGRGLLSVISSVIPSSSALTQFKNK